MWIFLHQERNKKPVSSTKDVAAIEKECIPIPNNAWDIDNFIQSLNV